MTQHPSDDFAQLRNAFNDPIAPSPVFAERLKEQVMLEATATQRVPIETNQASPKLLNAKVSRVQTLTSQGWPGALMTAAAILVVIALSFGSLRYVGQRNGGGDNSDGNGISALPEGSPTATSMFEATPALETIDAPPTALADPLASGWGGADRSWNMGENSLDLGTEITSLNPDTPLLFVGISQVIDDLIIRSITDGSGTPSYLEAIDAGSGAVVWRRGIVTLGGFASDGERLFVWEGAIGGTFQLDALNILTGVSIWTLPTPSATGSKEWSFGPIYSNGIVYTSSGALNLFAADAESGELVWQVQRESSIDTDTLPQEIRNRPRIPNYAISGDRAYVVWEGRIVESLDSKTGESLWSREFEQVSAFDIADTSIAVDDTRVYLTINTTGDNSQGRTHIAALNQEDGAPLWNVESPVAASNPVISGNRLVIAANDSRILSFDTTTGEQAGEFRFGFGTTYAIQLSATESSVFVVYPGGSDQVIIELTGERFNSVKGSWSFFSSIPGGSGLIAAAQISKGSLVVPSSDGQIWVVKEATSGATPESSPMTVVPTPTGSTIIQPADPIPTATQIDIPLPDPNDVPPQTPEPTPTEPTIIILPANPEPTPTPQAG